MKKRMLVLVLLLLAITLSGCENITGYEERFAVISYETRGEIVYDRKTGVEYWRNRHSLTLLVDKDGNPLIYEGE